MAIAIYNTQYNATETFYKFYGISVGSEAVGAAGLSKLVSITQSDSSNEYYQGTENYQVFEGALDVSKFGAYGTVNTYKLYNQNGDLLHKVEGISMQLVEFREQGVGVSPIGFISKMYQGADSISGSAFADTILGFEGNDYLFGASAASIADAGDIILGNAGSDFIYGYAGDDSLVGGSALVDSADAADIIYGGAGNDDIYGSAGNDWVYGESGDDLIVGGADDDVLSGGAGRDIFVHVLGGGKDVILDYTLGEDIITIERTALIRNFADVLANSYYDSAGSRISLSDNNEIYLGVSLANMSEANFHFYG